MCATRKHVKRMSSKERRNRMLWLGSRCTASWTRRSVGMSVNEQSREVKSRSLSFSSPCASALHITTMSCHCIRTTGSVILPSRSNPRPNTGLTSIMKARTCNRASVIHSFESVCLSCRAFVYFSSNFQTNITFCLENYVKS